MNELTPELSGKMRQFKRVLLSYSDFKHAKLAASFILSGKLHQKYPQESYIQLEALNCSMIIAYCRPFSGNDAWAPDLPKRLLKALNPEERSLHEIVMRDRNKVLAHSDADALQIEPVLWQVAGQNMVVPLKNWGLAPLTEENTAMLLSAAEKLMIAIFNERIRLEPELIPFMRVANPDNPAA